MARELQLNIDIDNRKVTNYNGLVKQGDLINLIINVLSIKEEFNLDGYIVKVFLKKSDGTKVEQSVNTRENIVSVFLDLQATTNVGKVYGELLIIKDTTQITSSIFTFEVEGTISQEVLEESKDSIETFNKVLIKLNEANTLIDQYSNAMQPIAGTTESLNALNNIKTTIDSNLDELIEKNQEALINKNNLDTSIDEAKKLIQSAETVTNLVNQVETNKENIEELTTQQNAIAKDNGLYNGNFQVNQRDKSEYLENGKYTVDRWQLINYDDSGNTSNGKLKVHDDCIELTGAGTNQLFIQQPLEEKDTKKYLNKKVTVSCYMKGSNLNKGNLFLQIDDYNVKNIAKKNFSFSELSDSEFNKIELTCTIPNNINKISIALGSYHTYGDGMINTDGSVFIKDVKLELGEHVTKFAPRLYGEELALCQRYYETCSTGSYGIMKPAVVDGYLEGVQFRVVKRITPTVSIYDESGVVNKVKCTSLAVDSFDISSVSGVSIYGFRQINILGSRPFPANNWGGYTYIADAEIY